MNIEFQARNFELDEAVRGYAERKLTKVAKFLEEPAEIRVTLGSEKHHSTAEMHVTHRHGALQAHETHDQILDAINLAVDKLEKQARRSRKRFQDRRRKADRRIERLNGASWPVDVVEPQSLGQSEGPTIIEQIELAIKPMSLEEAALQLEASDYEFYVFRDSANDQVSVLYRRKDNNYGLITPSPRSFDA